MVIEGEWKNHSDGTCTLHVKDRHGRDYQVSRIKSRIKTIAISDGLIATFDIDIDECELRRLAESITDRTTENEITFEYHSERAEDGSLKEIYIVYSYSGFFHLGYLKKGKEAWYFIPNKIETPLDIEEIQAILDKIAELNNAMERKDD